ncbi:serine hydrolase [Sphingorhabdus soli]|uniref:Serine hydrolase n=1 Tax=Flavisphingopyxis soli TaxID=2601267 RepID=A0A5C6UM83_9SPHN|nr:serine hydrolase [Sphingorhabdus soli]TXC73620.1 serine hydrolase [Sphingorhabdus soli]
MKNKSIALASLGLAAIAATLATTALAVPRSVTSVEAPTSTQTAPLMAIPADRDRAAVTRTVDALFAGDDMGETRALLVLQDGKPIIERYAPGFGPDSKLISWSMAKTVTAILAGMMVADGKLSLDAPVPIPAWQRPGDPRGAITLRNLLHMSSGIQHVEEGDPVYDSDTVRMLFLGGSADMAAYAEGQPLAAQPDEVYNYSSATSVIVADILARALTPSRDPTARRDAMLRYLNGRLMQPAGIASLTPEFDAAGTMIGGSIMHATARDFARIGELLRNDGFTGADGKGTRLLPHSWVDFMQTSAPTDAGYGGHLWLNKPRPPGSGKALWPGEGPSDIFAMLGHQGQYVVVSPSRRLTIVRLGISTKDQIPHVRDAIRDLTNTL